ncbi:LysE family transporter [Rummeliibacillus sp. JY-2-4R]
MSLVPFLLYVFVTSFTPGPNNIMAMSNANKYGFKRSLNFVFEVAIGMLVIMLLCGYFNLLLYSFIPKIKFVMSILGSLYMIYLAFKIMRSKTQKKGEDEKLNSFFSGILLQFINFKVILYGVTAISLFIFPFYKSNISMILFSVVLAFGGFAGTAFWAIFGSLFQKFLSKYEKPFNVVMGLLLIYSAISIFFEG